MTATCFHSLKRACVMQSMYNREIELMKEAVGALREALSSQRSARAATSLHSLASLGRWPSATRVHFETMAALFTRLSDMSDKLESAAANVSPAEHLRCQHDHACGIFTLFLQIWEPAQNLSAVPKISVSIIKCLAAAAYAHKAHCANMSASSGDHLRLATALKLIRLQLLTHLLQVVTSPEGLLESSRVQADDPVHDYAAAQPEQSLTAGELMQSINSMNLRCQ